MNNNVFVRGRKKVLGWCIGLSLLPIVIELAAGEELLFAVLETLPFLLIIWGMYYYLTKGARKEYKRSKMVYKGNLDEALKNCRSVKNNVALLDQGIYYFGSCHLSLYSEIDNLQPRYYGQQSYTNKKFELYIYGKNIYDRPIDVISFSSREETEIFIEYLKSVSPVELTVNEPAGAPSGKELDGMVRAVMGDTAADYMRLNMLSAEQIDAEINRNNDVMMVKDPDDPMFRGVSTYNSGNPGSGFRIVQRREEKPKVDPDDFFGKVPIVTKQKHADNTR